jgi:hypothetical protein
MSLACSRSSLAHLVETCRNNGDSKQRHKSTFETTAEIETRNNDGNRDSKPRRQIEKHPSQKRNIKTPTVLVGIPM